MKRKTVGLRKQSMKWTHRNDTFHCCFRLAVGFSFKSVTAEIRRCESRDSHDRNFVREFLLILNCDHVSNLKFQILARACIIPPRLGYSATVACYCWQWYEKPWYFLQFFFVASTVSTIYFPSLQLGQLRNKNQAGTKAFRWLRVTASRLVPFRVVPSPSM